MLTIQCEYIIQLLLMALSRVPQYESVLYAEYETYSTTLLNPIWRSREGLKQYATKHYHPAYACDILLSRTRKEYTLSAFSSSDMHIVYCTEGEHEYEK